MPDNRLQLIAELVDKVSPAAKKMQAAFDSLNKATSKEFPAAFKKYQTAVAQNEKALANFGRRSESTRREIRAFQDLIVRTSPVVGRMTESIGAFAIGTGSAIAAVGAVGAALVVAGKTAVDFAEKMKELQFGSKSSGLSITDMHQTQQALEQLNISTDVSKQAFDSLRSTMSDMKFNTEAYIKSLDGLPDGFKGLANVLITTAKSGAGTKEVFEKIQEQVDYLQEKYPGARGVDIAKRYVTSVARLPAVFGEHGLKEINEKLQVIKTLGASDTEIKEAAVQAERLRKAMLENTTILGKWKLNLNTFVTVQFLKVIDLLDLIEAKYNSWFGSSINSLFGGSVGSSPTAPGGGTFADFARSGSGGGGGPQGAGPRRYEGSSGGGAAPGGASPGGGGAAPGGGGGADTPFSSRFGTWSPAAVGGHEGHVPSSATGPLGQTRTGGPNIGGPPLPRSRPGGGGPPESNANPDLTGGGGGGGTGINRDRWLAELNANPALKESLYRHAIGENTDPLANQAVMEEAANRADIRTQIRGGGGFGSYSNLSYFKGYRGYSAREKAMMDENFRKVFEEGSDISGGAIDNSSQGLAWVHEHGGQMGGYGYPGLKPGRFQTSANFGGDRITGHRGVESFEIPGWGESMTGERDAYPGFRQQQLDEAAQRRGAAMSRLNLNQALSGGQGKVEGTGKISVDVHAGGQTARSQGIFKNLNLQRNIQMQPSNSGPVQQSLPLAGAL